MSYIVSRFPKVTETFIANEMASVAAHELGIQLFTLVQTDEPALHQTAARWVPGVVAAERNPWTLLAAQARWLRRRPGRLLGVWGTTIRAHLTAPRLLVRTAYATAVGVHWADRLAASRHVHTHWATYPAHIAWVAHQLADVNYSVTAHAHDIQTANPMMSRKLTDAAFVVTISDHNRAFLTSAVGAALATRLHVIRCGVDTGRFSPRPLGTEPAGIANFVCVASFMAYKGHRVLLSAISELKRAGVPARLQLIGDGELRGDIVAQIAELGLEDSVELLGWRSAEEVAAAVRQATAFVLASVVLADGQTEGIPVALMEAMASGVPVVATRVSGVPELVRDHDTGLLAEPGDVQGLAAAMRAIVDDPAAAAQRAARAVELVSAEYDHERNVTRLVGLFREQLERRR
jgi:colanic acid/amylovoran biosynthesis glycosyltransferase